MPQTLAQLVRAKYPGAYDDLSDQQLESSVRAKYPRIYDDIPTTQTKTEKPKDRTSGLATLGDFVIGALKGGGETAINLGQMLRSIPGANEVINLGLQASGIPGLSGAQMPPEASGRVFRSARESMTPTNTAQSVGKGTERVAELIVPAGVVGRASRGAAAAVEALLPSGGRVAAVLPTVARMGVEGVGGAAMSEAQGGSPVAGAVLGAAVPVVGRAVSGMTGALRSQASKQVMQALGPTKERFKAVAEKIAPQVLSRGLRGSREELKAKASEMASQVGQQIDDAITDYGQRTASTQPIVDALEASKAPFVVQTANGVVPLDTRALNQIDGLQAVMADIGDTATVQQLVGVRRAWDRIVSQAGGYQQRAAGAIGVPLADQSEAAVKREGAKAIRQLLDAEVPELSAINREYSFWKSLDDVLGQTLKRTEPQSKGLGARIAQSAGGIIGGTAASGGGILGVIGGAGLGASAARMLERAITSPRWALTSAHLKNNLAEALASGKATRIAGALSRITAVQASQVGR